MAAFKVLVTGGAGFIGTHLCEVICKKGWGVSVLDLKDPARSIAGVEYHRGNILNDADLLPRVEACDAVVHLAALVSVPLCEKDPVGSYETNLLGTVRVANAIAQINRSRSESSKIALHFASSAAVYGALGDASPLLDEKQVLETPLSNYAHQKRESEEVLRLFLKDVPSWSFRFFNVYGPGQDPSSPYSGVISIFSERLKKGLPLDLYGDGKQTRDFISVHDVVSALVLAIALPADRKNGQAMNLCTETRTTIGELGEILARVSGRSLEWKPNPPRSGDIRHSCGSSSLAKKTLAWKPEVPLVAGLQELIRGI